MRHTITPSMRIAVTCQDCGETRDSLIDIGFRDIGRLKEFAEIEGWYWISDQEQLCEDCGASRYEAEREPA